MSGEIMVLGTPNPRQREFLACRKKYIAFGGARGGGKSWAASAFGHWRSSTA